MKSFVVASILCLIVSATFAEPITTTGIISNVIVYRGQAMVTRTLDLELPQGSSEIVVNGLPERLLPDSLFTQSPPNIAVISVRYREKKVKRDESQELKQLEAKIDDLARKIKHVERDIAHGGNLWGRYDPYWGAGLNFAKSEPNRVSSPVEQIEKLSGYLEDKFTQLHKQALELEDQRDDLKKEQELLIKKRNELTADAGKIQREAVLSINKTDTANGVIELRYMVNDASWTPQYNLRANSTTGTVLIEQNAILHQSSGEDWEGVAMMLSTAQPTLVAFPPSIDPMMITIAPPLPATVQMDSKDDRGRRISNQPQAGAEFSYIDQTASYENLLKSRNEQAKFGKAGQLELNSIAVSNQMMEVLADEKKVREFKREAARIARTEGVSVSYVIPGKLTLPSRSDQQLVTITTATTKVAFTHIATPLLTDYVYVQGEITNDSGKIFLSGQTAMYRDNEFVGNGSMELVTIGEKFTVGFGVDSQVQVRRELEDKKSDIGWRTRSDRSFYRLAISNYRSTPVTLQLFDRIPYTENPDVRIELLEPSVPLSKNADYLRTLRKKGILRWDLKLAPNTVDGKATVITYNVAMDYPSDMQIKSGK